MASGVRYEHHLNIEYLEYIADTINRMLPVHIMYVASSSLNNC